MLDEPKMDNLPDEILVDIFSYLTTADWLNLARVLKRFDRIVHYKRIVRQLDFRNCHKLSIKTLDQFLSDQLWLPNVREINFNGCWWMTTQLRVIPKMVNLRSLHVMQCQIPWDLLPRLISGLRLETFAWTLPALTRSSISPNDFLQSIKSSLAGLTKLFLHVSNSEHLTYVWNILTLTCHLQILEVSEVACALTYKSLLDHIREVNYVEKFELPSLKECRIFLRYRLFGSAMTGFVTGIIRRSFALRSAKMGGFWISEGGCQALMDSDREATSPKIKEAEFISLSGNYMCMFSDYGDQLAFVKATLQNTLPNCKCLSLDRLTIDDGVIPLIGNACPQLECLSIIKSQLKGMDFSQFEMLESLINITELCLYNTCCHCHQDNPCSAIGKLKNLQVLTLSSCVLETVDNQGENVGIQNGRLYSVAANCTKIRTLIIRRESCESYKSNSVSTIKDSHLLCIALMNNLVTLELGEMPGISDGTFLPEICHNCTIKDLRLIDVGSKKQMVYRDSLISALNLCTELKYLKVEQKEGLDISDLKDSLLNCKKLETLKIISDNKDLYYNFDSQPIVDIAIRLSELLHLCLIGPINEDACQEIMELLQQKFKDERPAFQCEIGYPGILTNEIRKFPLYFRK